MCRFIFIFAIVILFFQGSCSALTSLYPDYKPEINAYEENYPMDRREFQRLENSKLITNILGIDSSGKNIDIIDFSRGGLAITPNNSLEIGKVYPIKLNYKNTTIPVDFEVITIDKNRVGTKFVNLDTQKQNELLYISARIELDNNMLKTKLSI